MMYFFHRILWLCFICGAVALFSYFVISQAIYLADLPKTVDVEVIFNESITFPTVTICNQNLFR